MFGSDWFCFDSSAFKNKAANSNKFLKEGHSSMSSLIPSFLKNPYIFSGVCKLIFSLRLFSKTVNRKPKLSSLVWWLAYKTSLNFFVIELGTCTFNFKDRPFNNVSIKFVWSMSSEIVKLVWIDAYPKKLN